MDCIKGAKIYKLYNCKSVMNMVQFIEIIHKIKAAGIAQLVEYLLPKPRVDLVFIREF
jgi:hypothetical protein